MQNKKTAMYMSEISSDFIHSCFSYSGLINTLFIPFSELLPDRSWLPF